MVEEEEVANGECRRQPRRLEVTVTTTVTDELEAIDDQSCSGGNDE